MECGGGGRDPKGSGGASKGGGDGVAAGKEDDGVNALCKAFKDISAEETEQEVLEFEVKEDKVGAGAVQR